MTNQEPIQSGEQLAEVMEELGISQCRLAKAIGVPSVRINAIIKHRRSITADTALRIGRALGTTPEYWLNLQRMYDLDVARAETDVSSTIVFLCSEDGHWIGGQSIPPDCGQDSSH